MSLGLSLDQVEHVALDLHGAAAAEPDLEVLRRLAVEPRLVDLDVACVSAAAV